MKLILLTVFITVINLGSLTSADLSRPGQPRFSKYAIVHQLFEMIRDLIRRGSEEKGMPAMDPYVRDIEIDISEKYFRLNANITKATITGLSDFYVSKSDFDEAGLSIEAKIIFPQLKIYSGSRAKLSVAVIECKCMQRNAKTYLAGMVESFTFALVSKFPLDVFLHWKQVADENDRDLNSYEMKGDIGTVIPLKGKGKFNVEVHYLTVMGKIYLQPSYDGKSILIDRVESPKYYMEKVYSTTQYDDNFDDIFNSMIGDLLAGYLNRFSGYITTLYTEAFIDLLNPVLENFDTWQIIATII